MTKKKTPISHRCIFFYTSTYGSVYLTLKSDKPSSFSLPKRICHLSLTLIFTPHKPSLPLFTSLKDTVSRELLICFLVLKTKLISTFLIGADALTFTFCLVYFRLNYQVLFYLLQNYQVLFYLLQNALKFSQIFLNLLSLSVNRCSKAAWELQVAFLKHPRNLCTLPRRL